MACSCCIPSFVGVVSYSTISTVLKLTSFHAIAIWSFRFPPFHKLSNSDEASMCLIGFKHSNTYEKMIVGFGYLWGRGR